MKHTVIIMNIQAMHSDYNNKILFFHFSLSCSLNTKLTPLGAWYNALEIKFLFSFRGKIKLCDLALSERTWVGFSLRR